MRSISASIHIKKINILTTFNNIRKIFIHFNVLSETNRLGIFRILNKRLKRLELIYDLHIKGSNNKEFSEYLNNKILKTFRTNNIFTPKLIWMTFKKYKVRLLRNKNDIIQIKQFLCVTPLNEINY